MSLFSFGLKVEAFICTFVGEFDRNDRLVLRYVCVWSTSSTINVLHGGSFSHTRLGLTHLLGETAEYEMQPHVYTHFTLFMQKTLQRGQKDHIHQTTLSDNLTTELRPINACDHNWLYFTCNHGYHPEHSRASLFHFNNQTLLF